MSIIKVLIKRALSLPICEPAIRSIDYGSWRKRRFSSPSPPYIKRHVLLRNGQANACWVETGTYKGETTKFLSAHARRVISIEPSQDLFADAKKKFECVGNIELINDISENALPKLLPQLEGDVNFWLDGHYSAGITYQGPIDTPVAAELECIGRNYERFNRLTILIDDVRCFNPKVKEFSSYPSIDNLVDWARKMKMSWHIEHDIFIIRNY